MFAPTARCRPTRSSAERDARDAEPVRLLLQPARVGDDTRACERRAPASRGSRAARAARMFGRARCLLVEHVARPRVHGEDERPRRLVQRATMRAQPLRLGVRRAVQRQRRRSARLEPSRRMRALARDRQEGRVASAITSPTTSTPAGDALARELAPPSARRGRAGAPRSGRPRSGCAPPASRGRTLAGRPRRARPARRRPTRRPRASSSCRRRRAPSRAARASTAARICGCIAAGSAVRRSRRYAGSGSPSSSKKTADMSASQCWPVCTTTSSMPASRSATESGPDLMN